MFRWRGMFEVRWEKVATIETSLHESGNKSGRRASACTNDSDKSVDGTERARAREPMHQMEPLCFGRMSICASCRKLVSLGSLGARSCARKRISVSADALLWDFASARTGALEFACAARRTLLGAEFECARTLTPPTLAAAARGASSCASSKIMSGRHNLDA